MKNINTVLIVIMNSKIDFETAKTHNWYQIPVTFATKIVKDGKIQIIAFYIIQKFNNENEIHREMSRIYKLNNQHYQNHLM
jgi:hypothetical protein